MHHGLLLSSPTVGLDVLRLDYLLSTQQFYDFNDMINIVYSNTITFSNQKKKGFSILLVPSLD
jgi:hypothetical protein